MTLARLVPGNASTVVFLSARSVLFCADFAAFRNAATVLRHCAFAILFAFGAHGAFGFSFALLLALFLAFILALLAAALSFAEAFLVSRNDAFVSSRAFLFSSVAAA